jgi:hypothetical protein
VLGGRRAPLHAQEVLLVGGRELHQVGFDGAAPAGASYTIGKVGDASNFGLPINNSAAQTVFRVAAR